MFNRLKKRSTLEINSFTVAIKRHSKAVRRNIRESWRRGKGLRKKREKMKH